MKSAGTTRESRFGILGTRVSVHCKAGGSITDTKRAQGIDSHAVRSCGGLMRTSARSESAPICRDSCHKGIRGHEARLALRPLYILACCINCSAFHHGVCDSTLSLFGHEDTLTVPLLLAYDRRPLGSKRVRGRFSSVGGCSSGVDHRPSGTVLCFTHSVSRFVMRSFRGTLTSVGHSVRVSSIGLPTCYLEIRVQIGGRIIQVTRTVTHSSSRLSG